MSLYETIDDFRGKYRFLSNFAYSPIKFQFCYPNSKEIKMVVSTVEHAYQARKTPVYEEALDICNASTPRIAKELGQKCQKIPEWEEIKISVMKQYIDQKFDLPDLKEKLLATGDTYLIEGNTWNDTYWGVYKGKGLNKLGQLLMLKRTSLRYPLENKF